MENDWIHLVILLAGSYFSLRVVKWTVDQHLDLPFRGMSIDTWEEWYERVDLPDRVLLKRAFLSFAGVLVANSILVLLLYVAGVFATAAGRHVAHYILFATLIAVPDSELLLILDRRRVVSPIIAGCIFAAAFVIALWNQISDHLLALLSTAGIYFALGWWLRKFSLRERGRL